MRICCTTCRKEFDRSQNRIAEAAKMDWKPYCSKKCQFKPRQRGETLQCYRTGCTNIFYRVRKEIRKVENSYCSQRCAAIANNQSKPKRIKKIHPCRNEACHNEIPAAKTYCSRKCRWVKETEFSSKELIEHVLAAFENLGRAPAKRELGKIASMCIRAFGSWNGALQAAGLEPNRSHSQRMYKRMNTTALDGHKCDSISEALIDNWLTKHHILHTRDVRYPVTNHKADWGIGNKIFVEYFGLAADSPRYDRSIGEKRAQCKKHGIRLVEIYPRDLYPTVNIRAKFPKSLTRFQLT